MMIGPTPAIHGLEGGPLRLIGTGAILGSLGFTRASSAWAASADGTGWRTVAPDVPRFSDAARRLLVEGQRTNLVTHASSVGREGWSSSGLTTDMLTTGPDGIVGSASILLERTTSGTHFTSGPNVSVTSGQSYTFWAVVSPGTRGCCQLAAFSAGFGLESYANFSIEPAGLGSAGSSVTGSLMTSLGGGWWLIQMTAPAIATASTGYGFYLAPRPASGRAPSYQGSSQSVIVWACGIEQASFASSPIRPPAGTSAITTRAADVPSFHLPLAYRLRGTVAGTFVLTRVETANHDLGLLALDDHSAANRVSILCPRGESTLRAGVTQGGSAMPGWVSAGSLTAGVPMRVALAWDEAGFTLAVNGASTTHAGPMPISISRLLLGHASADLTQAMFGEIGPLDLHSRRLPDDALRALTAS